MFKILLIDSSYPINTRNSKILSALCKEISSCNAEFLTWNRNQTFMSEKDSHLTIYNKKAAYGKPLKKLIHLMGYYRFMRSYISANKPDIVIASHWDMLLLASLCKSKNQVLIYEDLDIPTSSNSFVLCLLKQIEKWALRNTDAIIFASRFFKPLYGFYKGKQFVLENKPMQISRCGVKVNKDPHKLIISYIGLLRYADILKNLIDAVRNYENIILNFHGEGQDFETLKKYASDCKNVFFTGRYEVGELCDLYAGSDVVWAAYPNKDYNVRYAISNKFHESMAYHVPCIYAESTMLGDFVDKHNLGYIVDPYDVNAIRSCILSIMEHRERLQEKIISLQQYENKEKNWSQQFAPIVEYIKSIK